MACIASAKPCYLHQNTHCTLTLAVHVTHVTHLHEITCNYASIVLNCELNGSGTQGLCDRAPRNSCCLRIKQIEHRFTQVHISPACTVLQVGVFVVYRAEEKGGLREFHAARVNLVLQEIEAGLKMQKSCPSLLKNALTNEAVRNTFAHG